MKINKTEHIQIRISTEEKAALHNAAKQAGMPLSRWMRQVLLAATKANEPVTNHYHKCNDNDINAW